MRQRWGMPAMPRRVETRRPEWRRLCPLGWSAGGAVVPGPAVVPALCARSRALGTERGLAEPNGGLLLL